jgi:hypothetical protein
MWENMTYPQTLALTDRLNYLSAMMHRHALVGVIEEAMGIELSDRIRYIRTIMDELQRIDSHLLYLGCTAQDLGALTAFLYCMRDREHVLNVMEETTGGRLIQNYYRIGGLQADIDPNFVQNVKTLCKYLRPMIQEYLDVFGDNVITHNRLEGVGPMNYEDCINYAVTGPAGRASGWKNDTRKRHPYDMYDKVEWKEITLTGCDSMDRYYVHIQELYQSLDIIEQLIDNIPEAEKYIKIFTDLDKETIDALIAEHNEDPGRRVLQKRLAEEVTTMVHSREDLETAQEASNILFGKGTKETLQKFDEATLLSIFEGVPHFQLPKDQLGQPAVDLFTRDDVKIFNSKGEMRKLVQGGGVSLNKEKLGAFDQVVTADDLIDGKYLLVQRGKKNYYLITVK